MESKMNDNMSEMLKMPEGVDSEISHHPVTVKEVANFIIDIERMKPDTSESVLSTEFRDENLVNIMLDSIVEEQIVFELGSAPLVHFSRTGEYECSVTDSEQRSLVLNPNGAELLAVMLQGGSDNRKALGRYLNLGRIMYLNMSTYVHPSPSTRARPVALSIKDTNYYLSCYKKGEVPTLHLEVMEDKSTLQRISSDSDLMRFLFYKRDSGLTISTFMSAHLPGWYISTGKEDNKPVEMCKETDNRHRTFNIHSQS
uniref:Interleukin-1 n=1 Tax=Echeneis naucrates TaxID=173247 RepID=A0A665UTN0_ECHNA